MTGGAGQFLQDAGEYHAPTSDSTLTRMRIRGVHQSSPSSPSSDNWEGWAQAQTKTVAIACNMNAIDNFGMDGNRGEKRRVGKGDTSSWFTFQIKVAGVLSITILWLAAQLYLIGGIPSPDNARGVPSPQNDAIAHRESANASRPPDSGAIDDAIDDTKVGKHEAEVSHSIFDLSLFGNKSPDDFQLYTPHAPSCSVPLKPQDVSFTLVSQLSNDRMWMIQHHCERWGNNPMSIVVLTDRTAKEVKSLMVSGGCSDVNLTVQTVKRTQYDPDGTEYPVNLMRNLALSVVKTTHVLYADVDFWPSADLYSIISDDSIKERLASDPKLASVVPAFQMEDMCLDKDCREENIPLIPRNKKGLSRLHRRERVSSFDPTNVGGHGSTMYKTWWMEQERATFVDFPCIKSNRYEPYLVIRYCSELPPFQEGFTGYGKNKITWAMQLRKVGYKFTQIGGAFLVHYPHWNSGAREEWNYRPEAFNSRKVTGKLIERHAHAIDLSQFKRARIDELFLVFKRWLNENVEDNSRTLMCEDAQNDDYTLWVHPSKKEGNHENGDDGEEGDDNGENVDDSADDDLREKIAATDKVGNAVGRDDIKEGDSDNATVEEGGVG